MKRLLPILLLFLLPGYGLAEKADSINVKPSGNTTFNWGAKVGFNSILPVINSFSVDEVAIENTRVEYRVGYMAALFLRLNIDRFFIQPSFSWHTTESDIYFSTPDLEANQNSSMSQLNDQLNLKIHSLELPVFIGYNIVKQKPFGLSVMAGPKIKYNYRIRYTTNYDYFQGEYTSDDTKYRMNLVGGIGVTLWQLFIDFTYEVGINHKETNFKRVDNEVPLPGNFVLDKRLNMMGFSLGVLF